MTTTESDSSVESEFLVHNGPVNGYPIGRDLMG